MKRLLRAFPVLLSLTAATPIATGPMVTAPALIGGAVGLAVISRPAPAAAQDDDGGSRLERLIEDTLSGAGRSVQITGFRGLLSSEATLERMTISDSEGVWLTLEDATLDWNRSALLRGQLDVTKLTATRINVARAPISEGSAPSPEASGFALPDIPVAILIDELAIDRVELGETLLGEPVVLTLDGQAQLQGGEGQATLSIERLDGKAGSLNLTGSYANASRNLALDLGLSEGEGGIVARLASLPGAPPLSLSVTGEGPLDDFTADIALRTEDEDRLAGQVTLRGSDDGAQAFAADISGDLRPLLPEEHRDFFGPRQALRAAGALAADGSLALDELSLDTAMLTLSGDARIGADGWPLRLRLEGDVASDDGSPVRLALPGNETLIDSATLQLDFDADEGDAFTLDMRAQGLERPDLSLQTARISGTGAITRAGDAALPGQVIGDLAISVQELDFADAALARAAGDAAEGTLSFEWTQGEPLALRDIALAAAGLDMSGGVTFSGLETGSHPTVATDLRLVADDISRFSDLAGRPLTGAADVALSGQVQPVAGRFDLVIEGEADGLSAGIEQVDGLLDGRIALMIEAARDETGTFLRSLNLDGQWIDLTADAELRSDASTGRFDLTLPRLDRVQPGLEGSASLGGTLSETAQAWMIDFTADGPGAARANGQLEAQKSETGIAAVGFDGKASVDRLAVFADLAGLPLGGSVAFDGRARYGLQSGTISAEGDLVTQDLTTGITEADGLLAGRTTFGVKLDRTGESITLERLTADGPGLTLDARGQILPKGSNGSFELLIPELARLERGISGEARLDGTLSESETAWLLDFTGSGPGGANAEGRVSAEKAGTGLEVGTVRFNGQAGVTSLAAYAPLAGRSLGGGLSFDGTASYDVPGGAFGAEGQLVTRNLAVGIDAADRLLGGTGTLRMDVSGTRDGDFTIRRLDFNGPEITADVTGSAGPQNSDIRFDVALRDLGVIVAQLPGRATAQGSLSASGSGPWQVNTAITAPGGTGAQVNGSVAKNFGTANLSIDGNVPLSLANRLIEPNLLSGMAQLNLRLNGPLQPSSLSGSVRVAGAEMVLPGPALTLNDVDLSVDLGGNTAQINSTASLSSGGGLQARGTIGMAAPYTADLRVRLLDLVVEDRRLYQAQLGGAVTVKGPLLTGPQIGGKIEIDQAEVRIPETGLGPGSRSFVLTHINEPNDVHVTRDRAGLLERAAKSAGPGYVLPLNLAISAPARIFIRGRGLDAELGGEVLLSGTSANVIPQGRFDLVRGRLDILGQRLTLDEASLQLTGDFDPTLRVVATTERDGTTITVTIEGQPSDPEVSFSSSPSRPQEEVLALLLFGRDVGTLSPLQALRIAAAVNTLSGRGGTGIVENLRMGFGLDDLDVTTDEEGNAGLKLGKYINENIYTDVAVGSDGETEIDLNIKISPNVTARGSVDSTGNTGLGVFFEKDY